MSYVNLSDHFSSAVRARPSLWVDTRPPKGRKDYRLGLAITLSVSGLAWLAILTAIFWDPCVAAYGHKSDKARIVWMTGIWLVHDLACDDRANTRFGTQVIP